MTISLHFKLMFGGWVIKYADGQTLDVTEEEEIRRAMDATVLPEWSSLVEQVKGAFNYLENRLTDECASPYPYHCKSKEQHRRTGLLRAFNPAFAYGKVDDLWVHQLAEIPSFHHLPSITQGLLNELPAYLAACRGTKIDHSEVPTFTQQVLSWWASNHQSYKYKVPYLGVGGEGYIQHDSKFSFV